MLLAPSATRPNVYTIGILFYFFLEGEYMLV